MTTANTCGLCHTAVREDAYMGLRGRDPVLFCDDCVNRARGSVATRNTMRALGVAPRAVMPGGAPITKRTAP